MAIKVLQVMGKMNGGGVESVVLNYYRFLNKERIQFDFLCDSDSKMIPYDEIKKLGGRVILISPLQNIFKYNQELKKILSVNNYQIIHANLTTLSLFPLRIAKKMKIKVRICHAHNTTNKKEFTRNLLKKILRNFSKKYATNYFACSRLAGDFLFKKDYFLVSNAIDLEKFKYKETIREDVREELKISKDTLVIGHIGRFVKQKNQEFLINIYQEIFKINKNSCLLLVGEGPLLEKIKKQVKELNLENHVFFLGQKNDCFKLYQAFDIFLLPSLYEGLPVVGVEAQASSLLTFFSDKVTREVKLLKSTTFISLTKSSQEWAQIILSKYKKYKRKKLNISSTFDIKKASINLENKYLELFQEVKNEKNSTLSKF